jgi:SAM-dependent methyltransferase
MYNDDLAYVQHHGFADFARRAAPGLLAELRHAGITAGRVLDLGCGDGTWLRTLVDSGYAAIGIDQSPHLIRYATRVVPRATTKISSVYRTAFPRCDAITALGEVFSYCSTMNKPPPALSRVLQRAYAALRPGGVLIFDVLVAGPRMGYKTWRSGGTWAILTRVTEDARRHRVIRDTITFRKTASRYRRSHERHVLRVFTRRAMVAELRRIGFRVRPRSHYGDMALPLRRVAFVARKPAAA